MEQADKDELPASARPRLRCPTFPSLGLAGKEKIIDVLRRAPGNSMLRASKVLFFFFLTDWVKSGRRICLQECTKRNRSVQPVVFTSFYMNSPPPRRSSSVPALLWLFYRFIHNTRIHSAVPRRGPLNESTDSVRTLCCKKHCAVFLELPLCCLNVYMEQLGGLKTDVGSKNTASVQSLFSLDESNDTILKTLQTLFLRMTL